MKIHVCLVSAQAAANLLPALDPLLKPDRVVLVVSGPMRKKAENLSAVMKEAGIRIEQCELSDEHDYARTEGELLELAERLAGEDVQLNITGGTKLMSVAAQSVATAADWRMFYVDADTDRISWLGKDAPPPRPLGEQLRLRHYLQSYGFSLPQRPSRPDMPPFQQALTETLLRQIGSLEQPLSQLNWLSQTAEDRRSLAVQMNPQQSDSRSLEALLRHFEQAGFLTLSADTLKFADESARDFVKGGWLEQHVMQCVHKLTGEAGIRDKAANLRVQDAGGVESELDVAFLARNRLFVIECKTARMDKPESPKANDTLFKLAENCRRIGGLGSRGMLVSYRALRDSEKRLARALDIECVCGADINGLSERIKVWMRPH